jgi:hypothetical protein
MADLYGNYGVESGYNQTAPMRDTRRIAERRPAGRPPGPQPVPSTVTGPQTAQPAPAEAPEPFAGAQQTIGAQSYVPPNGNTGVSGGISNPMGTPQEAPTAPPAAPTPYQAKGPAMGLEGFDGTKLQNGHVSPKYVFAKHAQGLGVNDRDELLRRLQADESGYFKNAKWGGSKGDILDVGGGPLDPKFEGISQFDVIRAMGEGGKGWQWGGIDPNGGAAAPQIPQGAFGPATYLDPTVMTNAIMSSGLPNAQDYTSRIQQQIMEALKGRQ